MDGAEVIVDGAEVIVDGAEVIMDEAEVLTNPCQQHQQQHDQCSGVLMGDLCSG